MKTLYFDTNHIDLIGGGGLALYNLSVALQEKYDVHLAIPWNPKMTEYEYLHEPSRPFKIGKPGHVDVFVASKYAEYVKPCGDVNVFYCLYPRYEWDMAPYHKILTLSRYSQAAIKQRWGRDSQILIGGSFSPDYGPEFPKENLIVSSSRFFMEGDPEALIGHSKNQHMLIEAFKTLPEDTNWTMILAGSVINSGDVKYLNKCISLIGKHKIGFAVNATKETLKSLYAKSKICLHAMGYGRSDPAETEHYGICVEKALLSGCFSVVHNSGGAPDLAHGTWNNPSGLEAWLKTATEMDHDYEMIAEAAKWRTWDRFVSKTLLAFDF